MKKHLFTSLLFLMFFSFSICSEETQDKNKTENQHVENIEESEIKEDINTEIENSANTIINDSDNLNSQKDSEKKKSEVNNDEEIKKTKKSITENELQPAENQPEQTQPENITAKITEFSTEPEFSENLEESDLTVESEKKIEYKPLPFAGMDHPEVERFRKQYLSPKWTQLLYNCLENAMEYRLFVRQAIKQKDMPEILEYLPVVESNYKTNAKSRSNAIGMWQFMANSVYPFLTLNDYVDQRLDPWASTEAALNKLTDNYKQFNDWLLAIAAYNCGMGAMNRVLRKAEQKDFWYLVDNKLLPKQTAEYIPKLLAIADLAINAEYYGIDLPHHNEEFELLENEKNGHFDYIEVSKAYSLNALANNLRIEQKTIKHLNPSYIMGFTHPSKKSKIRLPLGMKAAAEEAIKEIEPIDFPIKYKVVAGDSLWSISRRYKTTVDAICELNGIKENAILKIGKILYIPSK